MIERGDFFGELALFDPAPRGTPPSPRSASCAWPVLTQPEFHEVLKEETIRDHVLAGNGAPPPRPRQPRLVRSEPGRRLVAAEHLGHQLRGPDRPAVVVPGAPRSACPPGARPRCARSATTADGSPTHADQPEPRRSCSM